MSSFDGELRVVWPAYAVAEPGRIYMPAMLFVRLVIFSAMVAATSATGTLTARDRRFPWLAGGIILAVSIPPHLYPGYVWDDYPVWYHIFSLVSIVPLAVLAGRSTRALLRMLLPSSWSSTWRDRYSGSTLRAESWITSMGIGDPQVRTIPVLLCSTTTHLPPVFARPAPTPGEPTAWST